MYGWNITRVRVYVHNYMYETLARVEDQYIIIIVAAMSILNYFKPKDGLPDPKGSLSQSVDLLSTCVLQSPHMILHLHALNSEQTLDSFRGK